MLETFLQYKLIILFNLITVFIFILFLKFKKLNKTSVSAFLLLFFITNIQLIYCEYTPFYVRQHDGRDFVNYEFGGHLGYIGWIFYNHKLPSVNPMDYWCFYNPPLFYIISAIFIGIQSHFKVAIEICLENLQILTLIYVTIFNIFVYKILKKLNIKKSLLYVLSFVGLTPIMIILSGSIGNGTLAVTLSTIAIYYTIKWFESDSLKDLIKIAFAISLAIMTKIDSALIAILIGIVFLVKVIKNKQEIKKYILYFAIFAIIALPIGLWYPIKNLIKYDMPITYVQSVDENHEANTKNYSVLDRLFTLNLPKNLQNVNVTMVGEGQDYNILLTTIKSMIVDENIDYSQSKVLDIVIHLLFYLAIFITIIFIVNLVYVIANYKKLNNHWILFFFGILILQSISYVIFCFKYPFVFTMNFRYIIPTLISFSVITGVASENNKILFNINRVILSIFSVLSIIMFLNIN